MPDPLAFASAVGMSAAEIGGVLVASFAGYRYPPSPDPEGAMLERLATEDLRLDASVIARDGAGERRRAVPAGRAGARLVVRGLRPGAGVPGAGPGRAR